MRKAIIILIIIILAIFIGRSVSHGAFNILDRSREPKTVFVNTDDCTIQSLQQDVRDWLEHSNYLIRRGNYTGKHFVILPRYEINDMIFSLKYLISICK